MTRAAPAATLAMLLLAAACGDEVPRPVAQQPPPASAAAEEGADRPSYVPGPLAVTVTDWRDLPVVGAEVIASRGRETGVARTKTDEAGRASFPELDASLSYDLRVECPLDRDDLVSQVVVSGRPGAVRFERGFTLDVVVHDDHGEPVAAKVWTTDFDSIYRLPHGRRMIESLRERPFARRGGGILLGETGTDGRLKIRGVAYYDIEVQATFTNAGGPSELPTSTWTRVKPGDSPVVLTRFRTTDAALHPNPYR